MNAWTVLAITPISWAIGLSFPQPVQPLFNTLFIMTLIIALYSMVLHARNQKLGAIRHSSPGG